MILEDDSSLNLLNRCDRSAIAENGNVQPKFIIQPKRVTNMDLKHDRSNFRTLPEEIQLCPLELRPLLKKSSSSIKAKWSNHEMHAKHEQPKKIRIPRRPRRDSETITETGNCNKMGDMYGNILGPTPDESILAGLQTVIDLCGLINDDKNDTDISPTTDSGSGHIYLKPKVPYHCTFETRMLTTSSDDASETFLTAPEYSSRKGLVICPHGNQNLDGSTTNKASRNVHSDVVENMEILQRSPVSRDDNPRNTRTKKNSKSYDTDDTIYENPACDVCPQCMKEIERLQATNLVYDDVPVKPTHSKQPKSKKICACNDVCTKLPPPEKAKTKPTKVNEKKEKEISKKNKGEDRKKATKKEKSMLTKEEVDIFPEYAPYVNAIQERRDSKLKDEILYQRTSQSVQPTTSTSESRDVFIEQPLPEIPKPSKENNYIQQKSPSSEIATEITREIKTVEECTATKRICDTNICQNRKQKSTCCPSIGKKKDLPEKSNLRDTTCSPTTSKVIEGNVYDECIKKVGDSGQNNVKPTDTCACSTDCIGSLKIITSQTAGLRPSSVLHKSATRNSIEPQEILRSSHSVNRIPSEKQTGSTELKARRNVPLSNSSGYRKSSGNQAGSRIGIIIEEEDMKPNNYQNVRSKESSIIQPKSSESVRETSSDVESSETSFRPSKSLQDMKKENIIFSKRSLHKTTNSKALATKSALSTKCFPPVEIPPIFSRASIVADPSQDLITYSCPCKLLKASGDREPSRNRSSHRSVPLRVPKSGTASHIEQGYDRRRKDFRRSGMPNVQPVIGECTKQYTGGDKVLDVRYAIVKISVFEDYTTYEIMKSSTVKPKKIPDCVEGIFVTKR